MLRYVLGRLLGLIGVVTFVAIAAFLLVHLAPGDPAAIMLGPEATQTDIANLREQLGLERPIHVQFFKWVSHALHGDLGSSYYYRMPVTTAFFARLGPTLFLTLLALMIAVAVGISAGAIAAVKANSLTDQFLMTISVLGISIPQFWLALNFILLFAVVLGWLPPSGYKPPSSGLITSLRYMFLPALSLGIARAALIARMTRASMLDVIREDHVQTARAKGLAEWKVITGHVFRNASIQVLTVVGLSFAVLMGGAIVIETVFSLPGIGRLVVGAVRRRDFPLIQGCLLYIGILIALVNLAVDLLYTYLDPRIKYN